MKRLTILLTVIILIPLVVSAAVLTLDLSPGDTGVVNCEAGELVNVTAVPGCKYNNSTTRVHEVHGAIPAAWDSLAGFDTNPAAGRVTAVGFVTAFGDLNMACTEPGADCFPLKLVDAYVGSYGGELSPVKVSNPDAVSNPERDIYFCGGLVCAEGQPGAVASGWIGSEN